MIRTGGSACRHHGKESATERETAPVTPDSDGRRLHGRRDIARLAIHPSRPSVCYQVTTFMEHFLHEFRVGPEHRFGTNDPQRWGSSRVAAPPFSCALSSPPIRPSCSG